MPIDALDVLCVQLTRDLFAIAKFLLCVATYLLIGALRERKLRQGRNLIRDLNPDFQINPHPDPDVCRIAPKMYWIHYRVGASHFAKYRNKRSK